ncbi:MAG: SDR family NAD(P)-dependent oxidoreductase [Betaproteobacteria bacterium]|nr:SDR family NAD(P)-dependent oxidoreductase [Betaproteobacteria bacterium]
MQAQASTPHCTTEVRTKTALVTGAGKRIGRAIALGLARAQWNVVLHYHHSLDEAQQTAHEVRALGQQAWTLAADLSDPDQVLRLFSEALGRARRSGQGGGLFGLAWLYHTCSDYYGA